MDILNNEIILTMKELSIEEKAKRYDKAIEIAKKINNEHQAQPFDVMTRVFPELKESEDERVRKELINFFKNHMDSVYEEISDNNVVIAWLEKQGEQKPTDKVEPKFKVGDVMRTLQESVDGFTDGMPVVVSIDEKYYHCTNELIAIKNQDDYEYPPMNRRQKSAWSEEDERCENTLLWIVESYRKNGFNETHKQDADKSEKWLKSLKERYIWKPSDEQMMVLNEVINYAAEHQSMHWNDYIYNILKQFKSQLKKLKGE